MKLSGIATILMSGTFLATLANAFEVTSDYLNSLTGSNISWSDSTGTAVQVGDQTFYYTYTAPAGYEETTDKVTNASVVDKLYIGQSSESSSNFIAGLVQVNNSGDDSIEIISDFVNNTANSDDFLYSAPVYISPNTNAVANVDYIRGNFVGNTGTGKTAVGGAIYIREDASVGTIEGNYVNNSVISTDGNIHGGAIDNHGSIGTIRANFIGNYGQATGSIAVGGAINVANTQGGIEKIENSNFIGNVAESTTSYARGGAIYTVGNVEEIVNSNFLYNKAVGSDQSRGGAIYSSKNLSVTADNGTSLFEGNTVNGESNAIYMSGTSSSLLDLNLTGTNNGVLTFNDDVDGSYYNINILGGSGGEVVFNQNVEHFSNLSISEEANMHMGVNASISGQSMVFSGTGGSKPTITVDIDVDKTNQTIKSGMITLSEEVSGDYSVIVNPKNSDIYEGAYTAFLEALNDTDSSDESFTVSRVIGNPYMMDAILNYQGETQGSTWYLVYNSGVEPGPDPDPEPTPRPDVTPEVIAGVGLHEAAIEQTRSVAHNVRSKVAAGREYCPRCGSYDYGWDSEKLRNLWVLAQGENANIDKPVDMEAKIWGVEAGFDFQSDIHNTLGVFVSYRDGEYDLSGKGSKLHSPIGSSIDIDSYLAGLYYRYDKNMNWLFATVYGGIQKAEVKTDDGVAKFDTDGIEFGAGVEIGRTIPLSNSLTLDPSLGLYYTQVNFDDADDNVGKHYEWDDIKHLEAELGAKLEQQFDNAKIYVKPSVIQTLTDDDSVLITGLSKADTYHDQTLGRIEVGGRYGFTDALSAYAWANYTFGSSYDAMGIGAGLNYAW